MNDSNLRMETADGPLAPLRRLGGPGRACLLLLILASAALDTWFALFWPEQTRFWDERYNARNVLAVVSDDPLAELNGYYPPLTWAPQAAVLDAAVHLAPLVGRQLRPWNGRELSHGALRFCRMTAVATGAATLLVVFLLAARLFDATTGLVAVALLGFCPWHLNSSAMFKPDAPLAFASALAALAIVEAARGPSLRRYLAMAAAVALAASAKQTGLALALPALLVVGFQLRQPGVLRRYLPAAAGTGAALLALLNFPLIFLMDDLETIRRFYSARQRQGGETRLHALRQMADWAFDWTSFGAVVGALAVAGLLLWALLAVRGLSDRRRRDPLALPRLAALAVPVTYTGLYFALTAHFKENNFLPVLQSLAIGAALLIAFAALELTRRLLPVRTALVAGLVLLLVVATRGAVAFDYVFRSVTPTTFDELMTLADEKKLLTPHSEVMTEWLDPGQVRYELEQRVPGEHSAAIDVASLAAVPAARRRLVDAEVRRAGSPHPPGAGGEEGILLRSAPRFLRVRGPALVGRFHPWPEGEQVASFDWKNSGFDPAHPAPVDLALPAEVRAGDLLQLALWIRRYPLDPPTPPRAWIAGIETPMDFGREIARGDIWASERREVGPGESRLRIEVPADRVRPEWAVVVYRWRGGDRALSIPEASRAR